MTLRLHFVVFLLAVALHAAVIRGTVTDRQTGQPLARALIAIHPVAGAAGATSSVRANKYGRFEFPPIPGGAYVVTVSRRGYAPVEYGQKRWKAAGVPVSLDATGEADLRVSLPRFGAITGRISDEADVGIAEQTVVAYRNTRPPQMAARAVTDDRGVYRIAGLEPGAYVVRSAAKEFDDGGYLPTFYKGVATVESAAPVDVLLDRDVPDVNIRPASGRLFQLGGQVYSFGSRESVNVILTSDMGTEAAATDSSGQFRFTTLAPGRYELLARLGETAAAWQRFELDRDRSDFRVSLAPIPTVEFMFADRNSTPLNPGEAQLLARRKDLSGEGEVSYPRLVNNQARLMPGRWEFSLAPNASFYVSAFAGPNLEIPAGGWADGWNEVSIGAGQSRIAFTVSSNPGAVHGTVANAAHEPVAGAPVYLEPYSPEGHKRLGEPRVSRTDIHGDYRFTGLPPGTYRLVASFEFRPAETAFDAARPVSVRLEEGQDPEQALDLWVAQ